VVTFGRLLPAVWTADGGERPTMHPLRQIPACCAVLVALLAAGCGSGGSSTETTTARPPSPPPSRPPTKPRFRVPPLLDPHDVYAADRPGMLSPVVRGFPERVYVPNSESDTVSVIDPHTFKVTDEFPVGALPQHVVPSYDLKTLWVTNDEGNSLTPIDPKTGKPGQPVPVTDPYNMYFTPNGALRDRRGRAARTPRLPRRPLDAPAPLAARPLPRGRPHGLHRGRPLPGRQL
jgi:YVTN family beta-propeller protein